MIPLFESVLNFTDLRAFLAIAIKHKRMMTLCVCLGFTLGLTYMVYKRPVYFSRSLIKVISTDPLPVDAEVIFRDSSLESIIGQMNSPHIMERTARAIGRPMGYGSIMDTLFKLQTISCNSEGDLILDIWPYSPQIGEEWPPQLVEQFLQYRDEKRFELKEKRIKSFTLEMERIALKIDDFDKANKAFLENKKVADFKQRLTELANVPSRVVSANQRIEYLRPVKAKLESGELNNVEALSLIAATRRRLQELELGQIVLMPDAKTKAPEQPRNIIVTPDIVEADPWTPLERDQRRIKQELSEAEKIYLPGHQKILKLKESLARLDKELGFELQSVQNRFNLEFTELLTEIDTLKNQSKELKTILSQDEDIAREFNRIQAGRLSWEGMYQQLALSLQTLSMGADKERLQIQYMGIIENRGLPVSPYRRKIFLYSLILGLGMAIAIPFLLEYLDDTISYDEQVERQFGIRTLGIIPKIETETAEKKEINLLQETNRNRQFAEYFRVIRVNLTSNISFAGPRQVIFVTSSLPKEGKSMVAFNLASSFAMLGEKTLLIDGDLRRGTLHYVFNTASRPGLGQILRDEDSYKNAITQTSEPNLSFLPCGRHVTSASELLESESFARLIRDLRGEYPRIILDTPPVLGLAETSSMAKHSDGVVMVIWSGGTPLKAVKTAKSILDANGGKFFGCVLNKLDLSNATAYYYYYYYSYKYYQAYHRHEPPKKNASPAILAEEAEHEEH